MNASVQPRCHWVCNGTRDTTWCASGSSFDRNYSSSHDIPSLIDSSIYCLRLFCTYAQQVLWPVLYITESMQMFNVNCKERDPCRVDTQFPLNCIRGAEQILSPCTLLVRNQFNLNSYTNCPWLIARPPPPPIFNLLQYNLFYDLFLELWFLLPVVNLQLPPPL